MITATFYDLAPTPNEVAERYNGRLPDAMRHPSARACFSKFLRERWGDICRRGIEDAVEAHMFDLLLHCGVMPDELMEAAEDSRFNFRGGFVESAVLSGWCSPKHIRGALLSDVLDAFETAFVGALKLRVAGVLGTAVGGSGFDVSRIEVVDREEPLGL